MSEYNLSAVITLNSIDISGSVEANSEEEAREKFEQAITTNGAYNVEIDTRAVGRDFEIDAIDILSPSKEITMNINELQQQVNAERIKALSEMVREYYGEEVTHVVIHVATDDSNPGFRTHTGFAAFKDDVRLPPMFGSANADGDMEIILAAWDIGSKEAYYEALEENGDLIGALDNVIACNNDDLGIGSLLGEIVDYTPALEVGSRQINLT